MHLSGKFMAKVICDYNLVLLIETSGNPQNSMSSKFRTTLEIDPKNKTQGNQNIVFATKRADIAECGLDLRTKCFPNARPQN